LGAEKVERETDLAPARRRVRKRIFQILEAAGKDDATARVFVISIISLIILNVISVALETVKSLYLNYQPYFKAFEIFSVLVFTAEYLLRLWTCTSDERFKHPIAGRIKFILTPLSMVDLLAIVPFYLPMAIPLDLRFIRAIRLFRLFRLFKIGRYSDAVKTLVSVFRAKKSDLAVTLSVVFILLIVSSSMMYYAENESQPQVFSSIPATMWCVVCAITNVNTEEVYPATMLGKTISVFIAFLGIGMFALPAGILASGFIEEIQKKRADHHHPQTCPHCGKPLH